MTHRLVNQQRVAVFGGSFNPFTIGHVDIVERGLSIFDRIEICIGVNIKKAYDENELNARAESLRAVWAHEPRVGIGVWKGFMAQYAQNVGASHLLRGVRSIKDYEYELEMADANRKIFGIDTVILFAKPELAWVTSSLVRELEAFGDKCSQLIAQPPK